MRAEQIKKAIKEIKEKMKVAESERNRCYLNIVSLVNDTEMETDVQRICYTLKERAADMQNFAKEYEVLSGVLVILEEIK
jgi:hypothetical protein